MIRGSQATAGAGEEVTVEIALENNPGISALNLYYIYDKDILTLTQVENKVSAFTMTNDVTTVWDAASNYTQDGTLATLTFEVAENAPAGDYEIQLYFISAANDEFEAVQAATVSATVTVGDKGNTLEGTVTSFGNAEDEVALELFEAGSDTACQSVTVSGNTAAYSLSNVAQGTYTLRVSKKNHVTRVYELNTDAAVPEIKLCLIGDVTGDGRINVADTSKVYSYVKGTAPLTDYAFACGDVDGNGKINVADTSKVYGHVKGTKPLW